MARLNETRRARIAEEIPPRRCSAHSSRTRLPCKRWAVVGADVCPTHGGRIPRVKLAAAARVAAAEEMHARPRRSAATVLLHVLHAMDVAMLDAEEKAVTEPVSLEALTERERARVSAAQIAVKIRDMGIEEEVAARTKAEIQAQIDEWLECFDVIRQLWHGWPSPPPVPGGAVADKYKMRAFTNAESEEGKAFRELAAAVLKYVGEGGRGPTPRPEPVYFRPTSPPAEETPPPAVVEEAEAEVVVEPSRAARPANVEDVDVGPVRAMAFVGRAIVSRCPGCGQAVERDHDQLCGWSTVSARAGSGFAR